MHRLDHRIRQSVCGQEGFTFIEIISVLLILGIISYFVATRLFSGDTPARNAEMDLVKNHLRYAQSRTMNTEKDWGIRFESATKYYLFSGDNPSVAVRLPGDESSDGKMTLSAITITNAPTNVTFLHESTGSPGSTTVVITTTAGNIMITKNTGFIP